jgi:hypothetical protein
MYIIPRKDVLDALTVLAREADQEKLEALKKIADCDEALRLELEDVTGELASLSMFLEHAREINEGLRKDLKVLRMF